MTNRTTGSILREAWPQHLGGDEGDIYIVKVLYCAKCRDIIESEDFGLRLAPLPTRWKVTGRGAHRLAAARINNPCCPECESLLTLAPLGDVAEDIRERWLKALSLRATEAGSTSEVAIMGDGHRVYLFYMPNAEMLSPDEFDSIATMD